MNKPEIGGISPCFIVKDVAAAFAFYCDRLGFEIMFQAEPEVLYFGIVQRGAAMIFLKEIGVEPVPNYTRDIGCGVLPWDAYVYVPDPDALAKEFASRGVEFSLELQDNSDNLRGFEIKDIDGYVLYFGRPNS
jgi:catechol 2,3-dioxygenase-like lactoylglutathione lyase family enzyme